MRKSSTFWGMLFVLALFAFSLSGCSLPASFIVLKSMDRGEERWGTKDSFLYELRGDPPHRMRVDPETGVETFAWDTLVFHKRRKTNYSPDTSYMERFIYYNMDCTYEISFDREGDKIGSKWIGTGCFDSKGGVYRSGIFSEE